ncbi:MAG: HD domain-containing protein [Acutalibacteraceae bacterium]|nr:HD domain-containing protein [Clostridia bacterium]MEE0981640.1 HD domain-containing protein [Acutalibacteraceae bacterium]
MNFTEINSNGGVEGFCLVKSLEVKKTAKGVPFLDLILTDSSGEIGAKLWDYKEDVHGGIKLNSLIKIRGTVSMFNDALQLRIDRVRPAIESDGVNMEDFVPSADYSGKDMYDYIVSTVNVFENTQLKKLILTVLERNKENLLYWPAAFKLHHAIRGGLLYHTLSILKLAKAVCDIYPSLERELLYAGVILHDVAKIQEFDVSETGVVSGYTVEGSLIGHLVKGAMNIEKVGEELGIDRELLMLIEHMILSHHGEPEFGAAVRPMFLEAEILSQLDLLDARIYEISQAVSEVEPGDFTPRQWALDNRKLYNHGLKEIKPKADLL